MKKAIAVIGELQSCFDLSFWAFAQSNRQKVPSEVPMARMLSWWEIWVNGNGTYLAWGEGKGREGTCVFGAVCGLKLNQTFCLGADVPDLTEMLTMRCWLT